MFCVFWQMGQKDPALEFLDKPNVKLGFILLVLYSCINLARQELGVNTWVHTIELLSPPRPPPELLLTELDPKRKKWPVMGRRMRQPRIV